MKQGFLEAFLILAKLVWEKELGMDLEFLDVELSSSRFDGEEINVIIGVSGNLKGNVIYGFRNSSALAIAGQMIGEPVEEVDEICRSILGELANMITGNAVTELESDGYSCNLAPPLIIEPSGSKINSIIGEHAVVRFNSVAGVLSIRVGLSEVS